MSLEYELAALAALIGFSGFFSGLEVTLVGTSQDTIESVEKINLLQLESKGTQMRWN